MRPSSEQKLTLKRLREILNTAKFWH